MSAAHAFVDTFRRNPQRAYDGVPDGTAMEGDGDGSVLLFFPDGSEAIADPMTDRMYPYRKPSAAQVLRGPQDDEED